MFAFVSRLKLKITFKLAYFLHLEQFVNKFVQSWKFSVFCKTYFQTININVNLLLAKIESKTGMCDKSNR